MTAVTMAKALNRALHDAMVDDERVVVFGQDVAALGGVFRITDELQGRFGEGRCFDTPLAESAIVGCAVGAAIDMSQRAARLTPKPAASPATSATVTSFPSASARLRATRVAAWPFTTSTSRPPRSRPRQKLGPAARRCSSQPIRTSPPT